MKFLIVILSAARFWLSYQDVAFCVTTDKRPTWGPLYRQSPSPNKSVNREESFATCIFECHKPPC